jgi:hypothetical protein
MTPDEIAKQLAEAFRDEMGSHQKDFVNKLAYLMKELNDSAHGLSREELIYTAVTEAAMLTMKEMKEIL